MEKWEPLCPVGGNVIGCSHYENNIRVPSFSLAISLLPFPQGSGNGSCGASSAGPSVAQNGRRDSP